MTKEIRDYITYLVMALVLFYLVAMFTYAAYNFYISTKNYSEISAK